MAKRIAQATAAAVLDPLVEEAQRRGHLAIEGGNIVYHCKRDYRTNFADPEEPVRAKTYSWLVLERSYPPERINLEVRVPRRTPNDYADIVVYSDDRCYSPYLVVENKEERCTVAEQRQGIEQGFGNANSLRAPYMLFDCWRASNLFDISNFPPGERRDNRLGTRDAIPANYGTPSQFPYVANGPTDIAAVPSGELETRVRRAHALIWAGGRRDPLRSFDEWSKLLFAKVYDERHTQNGHFRRFQFGVGENSTQVANRIHQLFHDARQRDPFIFSDPRINLPDSKIADVVQVIQGIGLSLMPIDALGHAFEHFFGSIFRGELGQYFTHRELARFMVAACEPTDDDVILDPTCGSGGFLLEALMQVWHHIDSRYRGQPDTERRKFDFAHLNLFGIEIHEILGRVCKTNLLLHKDGHTNIESDHTCLDRRFENRRLRADGSLFTLAIGNPSFGDQVKDGDQDTLGGNSLSDFEVSSGLTQIQSELVVLEQSLNFLRPGGKLAMIIPDGVLNNPGEMSNCPQFRRFLFQKVRIDAIVSLPDHAFRKSGAQNKTSILFATKLTDNQASAITEAYEEELERLDAIDDGEHETSQEVEEGEEPDAADDYAVLSNEGKALRSAIADNDYTMFLAEADHIGYTATGATSRDNELYFSNNGYPDATAAQTILGQYKAFQMARDNYGGCQSPSCMPFRASEIFSAHPTYRLDPKFHLFERERLRAAPAGMKTIRLGDVLRRRIERIIPMDFPDREFRVPTLTQEGYIETREAGMGMSPPAWFGQYFTKGSRWFRIREGDLIYSQIDLWKGCVTIVPRSFDSAIVTQEFPVYEVNDRELDSHYLKLVLRSRYFRRAIRAITTGHSNRRRTQAQDFENLTIFVPRDNALQPRISELVVRASEEVALKDEAYRQLLARFDRMMTGDLRVADFLRTR